MTSEGLGEMFEGDSAGMCAGKFPLVPMGGQVEGLACADPGARTPIGASGNFSKCYSVWILKEHFIDFIIKKICFIRHLSFIQLS